MSNATIYNPENFLNTDYYSRNIAIIGRGDGNTTYKFNPNTVMVMGINDSCIFYPECEWTAIVQAHYEKNYPIVDPIVPKILHILKSDMAKHKVVTGCTPSILISFLIKTGKLNGKNIYLQGFPLQGPSNDLQYPYDFQRQQKAFHLCFNLASEYGVNLKFVTSCTRFSADYHSNPAIEDIL